MARTREVLEERQKRREENRKWLDEYKSSKGCLHCGINHPAVLVFHHKDSKQEAVSRMARAAYGRKRLEEEIKKCDILCANCHRILHWKENPR